MTITRFSLWLIFTVLFTVTNAQDKWKLISNKDGIEVYTQNLHNSAYKAVRIVSTIDVSLNRMASFLMDVNNTQDWVYATKNCRILSKHSPTDLIYYAEVDLPWPISNRDFIIHILLEQDAKTKALSIKAENMPDVLPKNKGIVRIQRSYGKWHIVPIGKNQVKAEYILQVDPGGIVPAWLVNMFASRGPLESFQNLKREIQKPEYDHKRIDYILD